ncbi:MAG: hypothetical protein OXN97_15980 [Bryobacterales bacterium]|nr:hypothetical protein [Bryobacterales bacterium]
MANVSPEQAVREVLEAMEVLSPYQADSGARFVMPTLYHKGIHFPAVRRASGFAGIPKDQMINVGRMIDHQDMTHWAGSQNLLSRSVASGIVELYDDALFDHLGMVDPQRVKAATKHVMRFGRSLGITRSEQFERFPFDPSAKKYMTNARFRARWSPPR